MKDRIKSIFKALVRSGYSGTTYKSAMSIADYLYESGVVVPKWDIGRVVYVPEMVYLDKDKTEFIWSSVEATVYGYTVRVDGANKVIEYSLLLKEEEDGTQVFRTVFEHSTNVFEGEDQCVRFCNWMNKSKSENKS